MTFPVCKKAAYLQANTKSVVAELPPTLVVVAFVMTHAALIDGI